jgi:MinD superfamily P-loop ATPase
MKIAITSGKGGTGKTTVAVNLAKIMSSRRPTQYVDCDVEEPNGHLFLNPSISDTHEVGVPVPQIDVGTCLLCGECKDVCHFSALAVLSDKVLVFPEMCHGCGACSMICPQGALTEKDRIIGKVEQGWAGEISYLSGLLNIGEAMSPPLIKAVKKFVDEDATCVIDTPPGTSCPVVTSLKGADIVGLVAEPTAFGLNDLMLAVKLVRSLKIPAGVIINQCDIGDDRVERFCRQECLPVWARIPFDRRIAEAYSTGTMAVDVSANFAKHFEELAETIEKELKEVGR